MVLVNFEDYWGGVELKLGVGNPSVPPPRAQTCSPIYVCLVSPRKISRNIIEISSNKEAS